MSLNMFNGSSLRFFVPFFWLRRLSDDCTDFISSFSRCSFVLLHFLHSFVEALWCEVVDKNHMLTCIVTLLCISFHTCEIISCWEKWYDLVLRYVRLNDQKNSKSDTNTSFISRFIYGCAFILTRIIISICFFVCL